MLEEMEAGTKLKNRCDTCGSTNTVGMTRIVGYYSIVEGWNDSKKAELVDRRKGDYGV